MTLGCESVAQCIEVSDAMEQWLPLMAIASVLLGAVFFLYLRHFGAPNPGMPEARYDE